MLHGVTSLLVNATNCCQQEVHFTFCMTRYLSQAGGYLQQGVPAALAAAMQALRLCNSMHPNKTSSRVGTSITVTSLTRGGHN